MLILFVLIFGAIWLLNRAWLSCRQPGPNRYGPSVTEDPVDATLGGR